jgi:hypothetical protein
MENWKQAVIIGAAGTAAVLAIKGKGPAAFMVGSVALAVLASEYPDEFARIRREMPAYLNKGTRYMDIAMKIGSKIEEFSENRAARAFEELGEY